MPEGKLLSIIIPVLNEEKNLETLYQQLKDTLKKISFPYEIIFVDDGSTDKSAGIMETIAHHDKDVRFIQFSKNFGKETATTAGLHASRGDAALMIDADLQHPVELIPEFVKKWESGAEVVIGVRKKTKGTNLIKRIGSYFFYKIIRKISDTEVTPNATDFRLIDRKVINAFNQFTEKQRMTRALIDWLGFRREFIPFVANERNNGLPSYNFLKLTRLAFNTFVSLSLFPLKFAGYLGILIVTLSGMAGIFIVIAKYFLHDYLGISRSITIGVVILFLVGIILICQGLTALYIAHIHSEVINRPMYVIRKKNT